MENNEPKCTHCHGSGKAHVMIGKDRYEGGLCHSCNGSGLAVTQIHPLAKPRVINGRVYEVNRFTNKLIEQTHKYTQK
jgi:hypothetical protein